MSASSQNQNINLVDEEMAALIARVKELLDRTVELLEKARVVEPPSKKQWDLPAATSSYRAAQGSRVSRCLSRLGSAWASCRHSPPRRRRRRCC